MRDRIKRVLDLVVASSALVLAAPFIALAAVAIRAETPGPVLFKQERVGRGKQPIVTLKLRTMHTRSTVGPEITAANDTRVTKVGRLLRKTKFDEIPQLWNVIRGDMSIVGPRPEVARYVEQYRTEWAPIFNVRPGLTDLASIAFRDEEAVLADARDPERAYREVIMPIKLALALEGISHSSLTYDVGIMMRTLIAIIRGEPAREHAIAEARRRIEELNRTNAI